MAVCVQKAELSYGERLRGKKFKFETYNPMDNCMFTEEDHLSRCTRNQLLDLRFSLGLELIVRRVAEFDKSGSLRTDPLEFRSFSSFVDYSDGASFEKCSF